GAIPVSSPSLLMEGEQTLKRADQRQTVELSGSCHAASMSFSTAMRIASFTSRRRVRPCSTESKILTSPRWCFITTVLSDVLLRRFPLTSTVYSKSWFCGLVALHITTPLRISLLHANLTDLKFRICKSSLHLSSHSPLHDGQLPARSLKV